MKRNQVPHKHVMVRVQPLNQRTLKHVQTLVIHGLSVSGGVVMEMEIGLHLNGVAVPKSVVMARKLVRLSALPLQVHKIELPIASAVMVPL